MNPLRDFKPDVPVLSAQSHRARHEQHGLCRAGLQMCEDQAEDLGQLPDGVRHGGLRHPAKLNRDRKEAGLECAMHPAGPCGSTDRTVWRRGTGSRFLTGAAARRTQPVQDQRSGLPGRQPSGKSGPNPVE